MIDLIVVSPDNNVGINNGRCVTLPNPVRNDDIVPFSLSPDDDRAGIDPSDNAVLTVTNQRSRLS